MRKQRKGQTYEIQWKRKWERDWESMTYYKQGEEQYLWVRKKINKRKWAGEVLTLSWQKMVLIAKVKRGGNMKCASLALAQRVWGQAAYERGTRAGNGLTSDITSQDMQNYPTLHRMTLHEHTFRKEYAAETEGEQCESSESVKLAHDRNFNRAVLFWTTWNTNLKSTWNQNWFNTLLMQLHSHIVNDLLVC